MTTNRKLIGVCTSVIVVLSLIVGIVPSVVLGSLFDGAPAGWVPTFGTVGQTVVLYSHGVEILAGLTPIVLGFGFGSLLSKRRSFDDRFRPFVRTTAIGAAIPAVLAWIGLIGWTLLSSFDLYSIVLQTALALNVLVTASIPVFVATFTGAVLSQFLGDGVRPAQRDGDATAGVTASE